MMFRVNLSLQLFNGNGTKIKKKNLSVLILDVFAYVKFDFLVLVYVGKFVTLKMLNSRTFSERRIL